MTALYNEIDPYCAQWLRNLIEAGHIAPGVVDERSVEDITPNELREHTQVHCFAGIGVWSYALRLAGWPDDRPVWTGSCPCQPFSAAGKGHGFADERHLWPAWFHLIRECKPGVIFGEQVASVDGLDWLDLVQADLEEAAYTNAAIDLCAAGVGAPHGRQRLFFVADANGLRRTRQWESQARVAECSGMGDTCGKGLAQRIGDRSVQRASMVAHTREAAQRPSNAMWANPDWVLCRDPAGPTWRPVEPGTFPLAHGIANRVGRLRAYGNAINAEAAATFIRAYLETIGPGHLRGAGPGPGCHRRREGPSSRA